MDCIAQDLRRRPSLVEHARRHGIACTSRKMSKARLCQYFWKNVMMAYWNPFEGNPNDRIAIKTGIHRRKSRLRFLSVCPKQSPDSSAGSARRAILWYPQRGTQLERTQTDRPHRSRTLVDTLSQRPELIRLWNSHMVAMHHQRRFVVLRHQGLLAAHL